MLLAQQFVDTAKSTRFFSLDWCSLLVFAAVHQPCHCRSFMLLRASEQRGGRHFSSSGC